jgi:hypothetical protein
MSIDLVRKVSCQDNLLLSLFVLLLERVESWKVRRGLLLGQAHARGGSCGRLAFRKFAGLVAMANLVVAFIWPRRHWRVKLRRRRSVQQERSSLRSTLELCACHPDMDCCMAGTGAMAPAVVLSSP